ncbi:MAG: hypothetical protein FJ090_00810 [Deltaproteobacteria bacterium]|nr:hypothetical protein [Deltaproteobacteria bacterium]
MLLALLACIPIPYISPPADFTVAINPIPAALEDSRGNVSTGPTSVDIRAGLVPLGVVASMRDRVVDPTFGAVLSIQRPSFYDSTLDAGGYGRLAIRTWNDKLGGNTFAAFEPRITVDVMAEDLEDTTPAVSPGLLVGGLVRLGGWSNGELGAGFSAGPGGASGGVGVAYGEWGVAFAIDGGASIRGNGDIDTRFFLALEFRAPASAGVMLVPIH